MTVNELITALNKIENKELEVRYTNDSYSYETQVENPEWFLKIEEVNLLQTLVVLW